MMDNHPEQARASELYNTIPSKYVDIAVTTSEVEFNLNQLGASAPYVSLAGRRIRLRAQGTTVTYLAAAAGDVALLAGVGLTLADGAVSERYYVPMGANLPLCVIGAGAGTLRIFYD